jgi:hypothetical protein
MTWAQHHKESEAFAARAEDLENDGEFEAAIKLFDLAAQAETKALEALDPSKSRTIGITAVSAVALWYKAGNLNTAERLAYRCLVLENIPKFAEDQLRSLLQQIWNEHAQKNAGVSFIPGQVIVSVRGGSVVEGGAPLDLVLEKVSGIQSLFYRTAEYLKSMPLRRRGPPSKDLQDRCRPWLFQSVPGSYQFAVAIQKPAQGEMFPEQEIEPEELTRAFLTILRAATEDPENGMKSVVTSEDYRQTFLKLTRNLAPNGKLFSELEIRGAGNQHPIKLQAETKNLITQALTPRLMEIASPPELLINEVRLKGLLVGVQLTDDWLELEVSSPEKQVVRVWKVGETVDDVIGPMVNHEVVVRCWLKKKAYQFIDIERED